MIDTLHFASIDSTSSEAGRQLASGRLLPFAVTAGAQSSGRGRAGRSWISRAHVGLYVTIAVDADSLPSPLTIAPIAAGVGLCAWLRGLGIPAQLKWPNDLRVDGAKLGGILCEASRWAVLIGVGINWLEAPRVPEQETTFAAAYRSDLKRPSELRGALVTALHEGLMLWRREGSEAMRRRWFALAEQGDYSAGSLRGRLVGLAEDGALRLRDDAGVVHEIHAGDVGSR